MKNLAIILIVLFCSCEKDEPKSLIVTNRIDQSIYKRYDTPNLVESVIIFYYNSDKKYISHDTHPMSYSSLKGLKSYTVTSRPLSDDIITMRVLVEFYYTSSYTSVISYQSDLIEIHEGLNTYNITEYDLVE